jgi:protein phosphatase
MITVFAQTHVGRVRQGNEDHFLVADITSEYLDFLPGIREFDPADSNIALMVSDGMGGAAAGEVASRLAVTTVRDSLKINNLPTADQFLSHISEALQKANQAILGHAVKHPHMRGMGATATLAGILGNRVFVGQIGDSRAYLIREVEIELITKDQSFVYQLLEAGKITEEEAEVHPRRNIILQAMGNQNELIIALTSAEVYRNDYLLLCSDGLSGMIRKEEMPGVIHSAGDLRDACNRFVQLANQRGGYDNITVVLAHFSGEAFPPPPGDGKIQYDIISDFIDLQ